MGSLHLQADHALGSLLGCHFLLLRTIQPHLIGEEVHNCISVRNCLEELIRVYLYVIVGVDLFLLYVIRVYLNGIVGHVI